MATLENSSNKFAKGKRLYAPYGPTAKSASALTDAINRLAGIARQENAGYVRVEPMGDFTSDQLKSIGLIQAERTVQPSQTWQLDLTQPQAGILKSMSSTNRNLFSTAGNKGLNFETTYDRKKHKIFLDMIHNMASRTGMRPHSDEYFELMAESLFPDKSAGLAFGYYDKKPIVSALYFDDKPAKVRYYAHAGSFDSARKLQANSPLLTYLIMDAKKSGMKVFDFYGVAPADKPNHPWAGFSKFKRSFGGSEKKFNGTWEYPINKLNYKILNTSRKLTAKIKR